MVTFSSRMTKIMENVRIELYLGQGATGAQCTISSAGSGVGSVGGIEGSWTFEPQRRVRIFPSRDLGAILILDFKMLRWDIPNMHSSGSWVLRGSWTSKYALFGGVIIARCIFEPLFFSGRKFHVRRMRFRFTSRSLHIVSRPSRWTRFGFRARHTRCTRACGQ